MSKKLRKEFDNALVNGPTAVYDLANKNISKVVWGLCKACDAETPSMKGETTCLCCGQEIELPQVKMLVVFSREAHNHTEEKEFTEKSLKSNKQLSQGYDWDVLGFHTERERQCYINGAQAANGWDNEINYQFV